MTLDDLELAHLLADLADSVSMRWFSEAGVATETKADGSPVTVADNEVESTIQARLAVERPGDGVLGEEVGASGPTDRYWILDGIDGTHNFAAGRRDWSTHIALVDGGEVVLGMVTSPALGRRWWAWRGHGCWVAEVADGVRAPAVRLRVSTVRDPGAATISAIPGPDRATGWKRLWTAAVRRGDAEPTAFGLSAAAVASGDVDATVHAWGGPWDHGVGVALVEEAGGRFSDAWGGRRLDTGTAIFSNGPIHDTALAAAAAHRPESPPDT